MWSLSWTTLFLLPLAYASPNTIPRQRPSTPPSAASFYVPSVPGLTADPSSPLHVYAGNILSDADAKPAPSTDINAHLFFVLTKARRTADRERLIIWFNGGPGCSSFDGLMMEVGPWRMDGKDSLKQQEGGWEEYANVLYLDQPPGTGFSYVSTDKYLHELDEVSNNVIEFLKNWYEVFPEFKNVDTYLAGESFAGQYIPYIADAILKTAQISTPLKGIAIGNGWIDPVTQYPAYVEFAVKEKLLKEGSKEHTEALKTLDQCINIMNSTDPLTPNIGLCESVMGSSIDHLQQTVNGKKMCMNVYDIRLSDTYPACGMNWPPDLTYITPYLQRDDVKTTLHASPRSSSWVECRSIVGTNLNVRKSLPSVHLLPSILEKIPVMLFNGDQDFICNYIGTERMIESIEWNGAKGFSPGTKPAVWKFNGTDVGEWTSERNLTYVKVFGASHMVGFDVPNVAHDMMLRFMGVDFTSIAAGSAIIPSSVGDQVKPALSPAVASGDTTEDTGDEVKIPKPAEDDAALWQAYYNAGSAALVLVLIAVAVGGFFYIRNKWRTRNGPGGVALARDEEESIPLSRNIGGERESGGYSPVSDENRNGNDNQNGNGNGYGKGKGRTANPEDDTTPREAIFDVGDSDEEDEVKHR